MPHLPPVRRRLPLLVFALIFTLTPPHPLPAATEPYSGPAAALTITESLPLADFSRDTPPPDAPRELRLLLREAVTLTDIEKHGIKGGVGVRQVPVTVYGDLLLLLPITNNQPDYSRATGEITYLGVNRIGFKGPLQPHPSDPFRLDNQTARGALILPVSIKEPGRAEPRSFDLTISLDLLIKSETFTYTHDPDPSIPPWRADKTKPSGFKVTGSWRTAERRPDLLLELEGKITGSRGCYRLAPQKNRFFPVQSLDLAPAPGGMTITAHASPSRVDGHESQWAVKELPAPLDLRRFNGIRLRVRSSAQPPAPAASPLPPAAAVAFRVQDGPWFACRTVTPLTAGAADHVTDFALFARGTASPGFRSGPDTLGFPDLSRVDAIAIGLANPFGAGSVTFTAESLEAVRHAPRGAGEPPSEPVVITADTRLRENFCGTDTIPPALFGFHLANPSLQSSDPAPPWFNAPPVSGDGLAFLSLTRPGLLRPIDHTNFSAAEGAAMVRPLPQALALAAAAQNAVIHTITNENLWARPKWMDTDPDAYAGGIREMFRHIGRAAWTPQDPGNTLRLIEFWNEPFMWARHINRGQSTVSAGPGDPGGNRGRKAWNDPTQFTFMPGRLGAEMYAKFFNAAADGLRETNPHAQIGGMSSGLFGEDFFSQLTNYVAHFLSLSRDRIRFLTEHHYSSHPPSTAAAYEVVTAWSLAKHGKRWPIWNTEANDLDDIAPGDRRSAEAAKAFTDLNRAYYNCRDILELILKSRDKAAGRALHALWGRGWLKNQGEHLLWLHTAPLRGIVIPSASSDPAIIPLAAWENGRLTLCLLNDSPFPRAVSLRLTGAPQPASATASSLRLADDRSATAIFPAELTLTSEPEALRLTLARPLDPREITIILLSPIPEPRLAKTVSQHFSDILITDILPRSPATGLIHADPAALRAAKSATLRVIARDIQTGEASVSLGGLTLTLPATTTEGGHHIIQDIPLPSVPPPGDTLPVTLSAAPGADGFTLYSLSLLTSDL